MYFKDIIGQEEVKEPVEAIDSDRDRTPCAVIHGARGGRGVSAALGLRPLSELYEPDGDGRLRTLPVMP